MMKILVLLFILISTSFAATELAKVNSKVITLEDFNQKYQENLHYFPMKAPSKKSVLDDLIKRELGIQEAKKEGLDKLPEILDRMNTVLYQAVLDKKLSKEFETIQITDDEAKTYYLKNPDIRTSHIFVAAPAGSSKEIEKKALEKIKKIQFEHLKKGDMSFAEVAQKFSEGIAAPMGGDIDYLSKDKLDSSYYEAALKLKTPGKVSEIVRSQFGFHIIKLTNIRPWEEADHAQSKRMVFDEKRALVFEKYMNQLRSQAKVSIKSDLIKD